MLPRWGTKLCRWPFRKQSSKQYCVAREKAQLRTCTVCTEDTSSILSTHVKRLTTSCHYSSKGSSVFFWPLRSPYIHVASTHTIICKYINNIILKQAKIPQMSFKGQNRKQTTVSMPWNTIKQASSKGHIT